MTQIEVPEGSLDQLRKYSTAAASQALKDMDYVNTYMIGVRQLIPGRKLVARARTVRSVPVRPDLKAEVFGRGEDKPIFQVMSLCGPGDALVADGMRMPYSTLFGDMLCLQLEMNGADGVVLDGAIRDLPKVSKYRLAVFAANPSPTGAYHAIPYDWEIPIQCGGVLVRPGDVVMGDESGVVVIPSTLVEDVIAWAEEHESIEAFIKKRVREEKCSPGKFYPIDEETKRMFRESENKDSK